MNQEGELDVHKALRHLLYFLKSSTRLVWLWRATSCLFILSSEGRKHHSFTSEVLNIFRPNSSHLNLRS